MRISVANKPSTIHQFYLILGNMAWCGVGVVIREALAYVNIPVEYFSLGGKHEPLGGNIQCIASWLGQ